MSRAAFLARNSTRAGFPRVQSAVISRCRGICQEEAVEILRQFYTYGNPRAPAPKRAVTDGPRVLPDGELGHGSS